MTESGKATETDRDFTRLTDDLLNDVLAGHSLAARLEQRCPRLVRDIQADAQRSATLRLWGTSSNVDENTQQVIVPCPFIAVLGSLANVTMDHPSVHAGVTHTYGYLFSPLETPYGYKRARWVEGEIAVVLGVPVESLSPFPPQGTLLSNATYALGRIALRGRRRDLATLRRMRSHVVESWFEYPFNSLRGYRIEEQVTLDGGGEFTIYTDLVSAPDSSSTDHLLVYWWSDLTGHAKLITGFTIPEATVEELTSLDRCGDKVKVLARYNAVLDLPGRKRRSFVGSRKLFRRGTRLVRVA